ncbi:MAG: S8 family serine peptidase [bacterium]|nr:S8 family serine peptidase [bacterium]
MHAQASKRLKLFSIAFITVFATVCVTACVPSKPEVVAPHEEVPIPLILRQEAGRVVPGRLRVVLAPSLWRATFPPEQPAETPRGLERLQPSPELSHALQCHYLQRVWRTFSQLERTEAGVTRVLSYGDWVRVRRLERGVRSNARDYEPPQLPELPSSFEFMFEEGVDLDRAAQDLRNVPGVISVEPVVEPVLAPQYQPNDPGWVASSDPIYDTTLAQGRWGFYNPGFTLTPGNLMGFDIDAPQAWDTQRGDPEVVVAVFDNSVDITHEDLYLNIFLNNGEVPSSIISAHQSASTEDGLPGELTFYDLNVPSVVTALDTLGCRHNGDPCTDTNGNNIIDGEDVVLWWEDQVDDDNNGYQDDLVGWNLAYHSNITFAIGDADHGTPVAGLIAAIADNGLHIAGLAHKIRILPVRGSTNINKILYAMDFPSVRIINDSNSYGFDGPSTAAIDAVLASLEPEGLLYVASLGNHNAFTSGFDPSRREAVVSINNFQSDGSRAVPNSDFGPKTDAAAPGKGMYSLSERTAGVPGGTASFGGTSAASPVAAGLAALVASQDDSLTPEQLRQVLRMTASDPVAVPTDRGENIPGWDLYAGWGLVNAEAAVNSVINGEVLPEANILSLPVNYKNIYRGEEFSIQKGTVDILAFLGLPAGGTVDWILRRSPNWNLSGAIVEAGPITASYSDGTVPIHTINTDLLESGRHVYELEAEASPGMFGRDRAVVDLPRAYIENLTHGEHIVHSPTLNGFAYGPGFVQYRVQVAPGWNPDPTEFADVYTSTTEQAPALPIESGEYLEGNELLASLDIFSLPVSLPASGEATIRLVTEGSSAWTFEEAVIIDNTQPPMRAGFPYDFGATFTSFTDSLTAVDMNGDGRREIIVAGRFVIPAPNDEYIWNDTIHVLSASGTPLAGWPVNLPSLEYGQSISAGDVDGDGRPELVVRTIPNWLGDNSADTPENIRVFNHDGTENTAGWPLSLDNPTWKLAKARHVAPVLADATRDGQLDILISIPKSPPSEPSVAIRAFSIDGTEVQTYSAAASFSDISRPAVGDVDGDGENEIVAVAYELPLSGTSTGPATLHLWELDGSLAWTDEIIDLNSGHPPAPVLFDRDGDGLLEIIATSGVAGDVNVYDANGSVLASNTGSTRIHPEVVVAQLSPGTGSTEYSGISAYRGFASPGVFALKAQAFDAQTGSVLPGWSGGIQVADGDVCYPPIVADFDGDPNLEIGVGDCVPNNYEDPAHYTFGIVDSSGSMMTSGNEWPLRFPLPSASAPLVSDLDGNGTLELVVQTAGFEAGRLYVYDLPSPSGPGRVAWGEEGHDPRRSGNYHGDLRILSPTTAEIHSVGPFNNQNAQALLLVRTVFERGAPVNSDDETLWTVTVGNQTPTIREVARVQGEHWLLVEPVTQPAPGSYTIHVEFDDGGIPKWDRYRDAVHYEPMAYNQSQTVTIDRSGSMSYSDKLPSAKVAARFFAEASAPSDELGIVSFNDIATDDLGSGVLTAGPNRSAVATAISNLAAQGSTSIGAGIREAITILDNTATANNNWGLVLLTDGLENTAPFWSLPGSPPPVRPDVQTLMENHPEFSIHTIALGPDADQGLLETIAGFTGGSFYPVYLGNSLSLFNRLADVYHSIREELETSQRVLTHGAQFEPNDAWQGSFRAPQGSRRLQIAVNWDRPSQDPQVRPFSLTVTRPDATVLQPTDPGVLVTENLTDFVLTTSSPDPGPWEVALSNLSEEALEALVVISTVSPLRGGTVIGPTNLDNASPSSTVMAYATDSVGFVRAASATLSVTAPDKTERTYTMTDDGQGSDDSAGDGIFSAHVDWSKPGSYLLVATIWGEGSLGEFRISRSAGYYNREGTDRDADGMPDSWELKYAQRCSQGLDPDSDLDGDGLDNLTEWRRGFDPLNRDTDGDGTDDGDE